jgi:hypothetical protein
MLDVDHVPPARPPAEGEPMTAERKPEDEFPTLREDDRDPAYDKMPVEPPDDPDIDGDAQPDKTSDTSDKS